MKKQIFIFAFLLVTSFAFSQTKINGRIKNDENKPVEGASILEKSSGKGTLSDSSGNFTMEVNSLPVLLEVSSSGFQSVTITVRDLRTQEITLSSMDNMLQDVVVVGYSTQKKVNLTGAVATVKMDDVLGNRPVSSPALALQGAIPGLQITNGSGRPGEGTSLQIRGVESINGGSPLVLIDNVPGSLNDLNPQDIETVSVLKDAAASSIYGGRAAFGVILITTKKGRKNQKIKFNYTSNLSFTRPMDLPQKASALDYIRALRAYGETASWTGQNLNVWETALLDYQKQPSAYPNGEFIDPSNNTRYRLLEEDLYGKFMTNSVEHMHNLSFSGGSTNSSYRVSLGYADEDGIMITNKDSYKKYNANIFLNSSLSKNIEASVNILYRNDNRLTPANFSALFNQAVGFGDWMNTGYDTISTPTRPASGLPFSTPNNYLNLEPAQESFGSDLRMLGKLDYTVAKGFKITGEYTFRTVNGNTRNFTTNRRYIAATTYNEEPINTESRFTRSNSVTNVHALNLYATHEKTFGKHNIKLLAGSNQEISRGESFTTTRTGVITPVAPSLSTSSGIMTNSDAYNEFSLSGYFSRVNYSFKNKYLLEGNMRYDGSSKFAPGKRFGLFPSASVGWVISNEGFMGGIKKSVNLAKIRASFGEIGNQSVAPYAFIPGMETRNAFWIDPVTNVRYLTILPPNLVSSDFTWERVLTKNIGVDLGFFRNRMTFTFDYFVRLTKDMLTQGAELPATLGTSAPFQNAANLESKGFELNMAWSDKIKAFHYSIGFNLSDNQGVITKFKNAGGLLSQYYEGYRFGEIWGYETQGYLDIDDFVRGSLDANLRNGTLNPGISIPDNVLNPVPGDIRFADLNGDGKINPGNSTLTNPGDTRIIGNSTRRYQYGGFANISYKGFDLSLFVQGVGKRDLWISNQLSGPFRAGFEMLYQHQLDYWTKDNTTAFYPRGGLGSNFGTSNRVQTKYLLNGAYFRIKNIEVGYSIPASVIRKIGMSNARTFISAENIFTKDHLAPGLDPEVDNVTRGAGYPLIKKVSIGLNISF